MTDKKTIEKVKKMIPLDFGKTISQIKKELLTNSLENYGASDHLYSKNGYSLFYTTNHNFQNQGKKGAGLYARLRFVGITKDIKIS